jgi:hypothetical protein
MKSAAFALLGFSLACLVACQERPSYALKKLPSGREVKILSVGRIYSTQEEAWIIRLRYETELPLDNPAGLQVEIDDIWKYFRVDADQSGFKFAAVTAVEPSRVPGVEVHRQFGFLFVKDEKGTWRARTTNREPNQSQKADVAKAAGL